jgi:hypothetical protein
MEKVYQAKKVPNISLGKWRSVEFELIFKKQCHIQELIKYVKDNKYTDFITIKYDYSIHDNDDIEHDLGREIVVSYLAGNEKIVYDVCEFLKDRAYVNASCGTHVHFDMRGLTRDRVKTYGQRLGKCVKALKEILPKSRRDNYFCDKDVNTLDSWDRYAFVNLAAYKRHKTLEIRGHSGTIDADKILKWIKICDKIMRSRGDNKNTKSVKEMVEKFRFNKDVKRYIEKRYVEVNKVIEEK